MKASVEMGSDGQPVDRGPAPGKGFKLEAIAVFQDMNKQGKLSPEPIVSFAEKDSHSVLKSCPGGFAAGKYRIRKEGPSLAVEASDRF